MQLKEIRLFLNLSKLGFKSAGKIKPASKQREFLEFWGFYFTIFDELKFEKFTGSCILFQEKVIYNLT